MGNSLKEFNHIDLLWPSKYLKAGDLRGKDVTVIIDDIEPRHELMGANGRTDNKPVLWLRTPSGRKIEKAMICNKTNGKRIAAMYGPEITEWIGKPITIHAEPEPKSDSGEAIRVKKEKPRIESAKKADKTPAEQEPSHEPSTGEVSGTAGEADYNYTEGFAENQ